MVLDVGLSLMFARETIYLPAADALTYVAITGVEYDRKALLKTMTVAHLVLSTLLYPSLLNRLRPPYKSSKYSRMPCSPLRTIASGGSAHGLSRRLRS